MDASKKLPQYGHQDSNSVKDASVEAGSITGDRTTDFDHAGNAADPEHINNVWNKGAVGPVEVPGPSGKNYNSMP